MKIDRKLASWLLMVGVSLVILSVVFDIFRLGNPISLIFLVGGFLIAITGSIIKLFAKK